MLTDDAKQHGGLRRRKSGDPTVGSSRLSAEKDRDRG
jgi:hypothetical protein